MQCIHRFCDNWQNISMLKKSFLLGKVFPLKFFDQKRASITTPPLGLKVKKGVNRTWMILCTIKYYIFCTVLFFVSKEIFAVERTRTTTAGGRKRDDSTFAKVLSKLRYYYYFSRTSSRKKRKKGGEKLLLQSRLIQG